MFACCAFVTTIYTTTIVISWLFCCYQYLSHVLFPCMLTTTTVQYVHSFDKNLLCRWLSLTQNSSILDATNLHLVLSLADSKEAVCKAPRCMVLASDERRLFDIGYTNHHCELLPLLCYNHALFHGLVRILMLFAPWLSPCWLLCRWSSVVASFGYFICCS